METEKQLVNLKNNFTTPEQSKKLMGAGLPAKSADCYYYTEVDKTPKVLTKGDFNWSESPYIPCWSVGQLQRIFKECAKDDAFYYAAVDCAAHQDNIIDSWCLHFLAAEVLLDLSKLKRKDYE